MVLRSATGSEMAEEKGCVSPLDDTVLYYAEDAGNKSHSCAFLSLWTQTEYEEGMLSPLVCILCTTYLYFLPVTLPCL